MIRRSHGSQKLLDRRRLRLGKNVCRHGIAAARLPSDPWRPGTGVSGRTENRSAHRAGNGDADGRLDIQAPHWDIERAKAYITDKAEPVTFFCGGSRNSSQFIDLLNGVFVLEVDVDTMNRRIDERLALDPTDFGATPEERDLISQRFATKEDLPKSAMGIDATAPVARVVEDILSKCGEWNLGAYAAQGGQRAVHSR